MVEKITKGIKISVQTKYEGRHLQKEVLLYAFSYFITIENQSNDSVQLESRYWQVFDALNNMELVEGEGVIGKKPILNPGDAHSYTSGCLLTSPFGAMDGHYNMVNFTTGENFKVSIPNFKLSAHFALN